jgi:hypothetical protein
MMARCTRNTQPSRVTLQGRRLLRLQLLETRCQACHRCCRLPCCLLRLRLLRLRCCALLLLQRRQLVRQAHHVSVLLVLQVAMRLLQRLVCCLQRCLEPGLSSRQRCLLLCCLCVQARRQRVNSILLLAVSCIREGRQLLLQLLRLLPQAGCQALQGARLRLHLLLLLAQLRRECR